MITLKLTEKEIDLIFLCMERYDDNYYDKRNPILFLEEKIDKQIEKQSWKESGHVSYVINKKMKEQYKNKLGFIFVSLVTASIQTMNF